MSDTEPLRIAVAAGLAALGRHVLCARDECEHPRDTQEQLFRQLGPIVNQYEWTLAIWRLLHVAGRGSVLFINNQSWERARGYQFHHFIGGVWLDPNKREILNAQVRLML